MGFELGPKPLRRAPRGWAPARAFPLRHAIYDTPNHGPEGGGDSVFDASYGMEVTWRVEVEGYEPYEVQETRSAPTWTLSGPMGAGNRWYKVRVRPTYGLMPAVGVPCFVDPGDRAQLWIDWDKAYDEHVPAWEREARVRRGVSDRDNAYEKVVGRISNPFAGKLREGEEELVEQRIADQAERMRELQAKYAPPPPDPATAGESAELKRRMDELTRIQRTGTKTRATVVAREETDRTFANVPVIVLTLRIEDREVVFEHVFGPRHAKHYKVGREIDVWVDRNDPDAICPGR
jgi:hypothetical protein